MDYKFKLGDIFYRIWKTNQEVCGEEYKVKTIIDEKILICTNRNQEEKYISIQDPYIILDKYKAIAKYNILKQSIATTSIKPKTTKHTLKEKSPNIQRFNSLHIGEKRYIVTNTNNGPTLAEYIIEKILRDSKSVILKDIIGNSKKIYFNSINTLLTKSEADAKLSEYIKIGPCSVANNLKNTETNCHKCGATIIRHKHNYCPVCNGHRCIICGNCLCEFN